MHHVARRNLVEWLIQRTGLRRASSYAAKLIAFEIRPDLWRTNAGPIEEAYVVAAEQQHGCQSQRHATCMGSKSTLVKLSNLGGRAGTAAAGSADGRAETAEAKTGIAGTRGA